MSVMYGIAVDYSENDHPYVGMVAFHTKEQALKHARELAQYYAERYAKDQTPTIEPIKSLVVDMDTQKTSQRIDGYRGTWHGQSITCTVNPIRHIE